MPETRIGRRFAKLKAEGRSGLVSFLTAGDPDLGTTREIMAGLPAAGVDLIELGMPFSDPMADGPSIQQSSLRALKNGMTLSKTIDLVRGFRHHDDETPIILMGYYNPIYKNGVDRFLADAKDASIDGLIMVDLPPEEEDELCLPAIKAGLNFVYLTAPTTDDARLPKVLENASGFVYYVSITGITGTRAAAFDDIRQSIERIRRRTDLPIAVGFGIRTPKQTAEVAAVADAVVVGSALVDLIRDNLDADCRAKPELVDCVLDLVSELAKGVRIAGGR